MTNVLIIFGGVALLLFGVRYLRNGLDRLFGPRLGKWLQKLASLRGWSFLGGLMVSILAPSSTTMSLLAVQTMQSGNLLARQMLAIMLGANVGLTIMVLLISLRLEQFAPVLILFGVLLYEVGRGGRNRGLGQVLLAIGFLFLGIDIMRRAAEAAVSAGAMGDWQVLLDVLPRHAFLLATVAAGMAMLLQSSTATIGLVIGLGSEAVSFRTAVPVVVGANIGLAVTTLLVGWRLCEPRRLALANLLLKGGVGLATLVFHQLLADYMPVPSGPGEFALAVAGLHTGFNVVVAAVGLPLVGPVTRLMERIVPPPPGGPMDPYGTRYISPGPIGGVALAMGQSLREIANVSEIVRAMLRDIWTAMRNNDERLAHSVSDRDDRVDALDAEIKRFLTRLAMEETAEYDADEQMRQLRYLTELETVGDIIDKNIADLVLKKIRIGAEFSPEGAAELEDFYRKVTENVVIAETLFTTRDRALAQQLLRHKKRIDEYERELRDRHFARLNAGLAQAHETSAIHLDLLTHLKRINSCASHVAYPILQDSHAASGSGTAATPPAAAA